jgi:hypothetical protein
MTPTTGATIAAIRAPPVKPLCEECVALADEELCERLVLLLGAEEKEFEFLEVLIVLRVLAVVVVVVEEVEVDMPNSEGSTQPD